MMKPLSLVAIVLTKNEERDLAACLDSLIGVASEVFVVDSGSTGRTVTIAEERGAQVLSHVFHSHAVQFNWALANIPSSCEWILRIDADERLSSELRAELLEHLPSVGEHVAGFMLPLRIRFLGCRLRWGASYPIWLLRLFRRGRGSCEDRLMDEQIVVTGGLVENIHGDLIHEIPKSLMEWTTKHNWYAGRECMDTISGRSDHKRATAPVLRGPPALRRWHKRNVYGRAPLFLRAFLYWAYRYCFRLGFLDGWAGLIYHFLQSFWYRFLVDAMIYETEKRNPFVGPSEHRR
jgi:glycosyltransferase involved in cell wall biosynthesis